MLFFATPPRAASASLASWSMPKTLLDLEKSDLDFPAAEPTASIATFGALRVKPASSSALCWASRARSRLALTRSFSSCDGFGLPFALGTTSLAFLLGEFVVRLDGASGGAALSTLAFASREDFLGRQTFGLVERQRHNIPFARAASSRSIFFSRSFGSSTSPVCKSTSKRYESVAQSFFTSATMGSSFSPSATPAF